MKSEERSRLFQFFEAESDKLLRYVHARARRISEMDAEDIIGEVMLKLLKRTDSSGPVENIAAYTYRSVRNKIADYHKEKQRTISLDGFASEDKAFSLREMLADGTQNIPDRIQRKELRKALSESIDKLEPKQRAVLIATEMHGRSFRELSQAWNEPVGTLLSRKSRAAKALREMLKDQFADTK